MSIPLSFSGRVALIAGAGGGIGLNIAHDLLAADLDVVLADEKPEPADIDGGSGSAIFLQGDLSDEKFVIELVEAVRQRFGRLDYLVNTTGVLWFDRDASFATIDLDLWDRVFDINLKSFVLTARHVIPLMLEQGGGAMVHFSSIDALRGDLNPQDAYAISKAAVIRFSKSVAVQYADRSIRSNVILPGPVLSPMQIRWEGKEKIQQDVAQMIPLGRLGRTQDPVNACLFLLSDEASWITGTDLTVDGGLSARG
jgi:3-oxoacyl-[acyl-carrier protein] reductase